MAAASGCIRLRRAGDKTRRAEFTYWLGVAVVRYGHVVAGCSTVNAGGVGLNALDQRRRQGAAFGVGGLVWSWCPALVLHAGFLHSGIGASLRAQGCDGIGTLLNGITTGVSPMTLSQHPMDHARKRARSTTAKGGRCSRKLALLFFTPTHAQFLPCRVAGPPA